MSPRSHPAPWIFSTPGSYSIWREGMIILYSCFQTQVIHTWGLRSQCSDTYMISHHFPSERYWVDTAFLPTLRQLGSLRGEPDFTWPFLKIDSIGLLRFFPASKAMRKKGSDALCSATQRGVIKRNHSKISSQNRALLKLTFCPNCIEKELAAPQSFSLFPHLRTHSNACKL